MNDQQVDALVERFKCREHRRWKLLSCFAITIVACVFLLFAFVFLPGAVKKGGKPAVMDEIRATRFVLLDKEQKVRAELGAADDGTGLILNDNNEKLRTPSSRGEPSVPRPASPRRSRRKRATRFPLS